MKKRTKKPSDHKSELTRLKSGKLPYAKLDPTFKIRSEDDNKIAITTDIVEKYVDIDGLCALL